MKTKEVKMNEFNETSGITTTEAEALFSANQKENKKNSIFVKIKDAINMKKSEKLLKKQDICKVLDSSNQR